jgi:hypothetical protein
MEKESKIIRTGPNNTLINEHGLQVIPPTDWAFLAAGDAAITRKVTAQGQFWRVQAQMGRRTISKGLWAPEATIARAREEVEAQRATDTYKNKLASDRKRRAQKQTEYEQEFLLTVRAFLGFAPRYEAEEKAMAEAVTVHAIPVGSGTVARTTQIPIEERAAKAVIAWMRHQTTAYDGMRIARIKGERREVRRMLAQRSMELLRTYREGREPVSDCPLKQALDASANPEKQAAGQL